MKYWPRAQYTEKDTLEQRKHKPKPLRENPILKSFTDDTTESRKHIREVPHMRRVLRKLRSCHKLNVILRTRTEMQIVTTSAALQGVKDVRDNRQIPALPKKKETNSEKVTTIFDLHINKWSRKLTRELYRWSPKILELPFRRRTLWNSASADSWTKAPTLHTFSAFRISHSRNVL